jgi:hypothetical protein
METNDDRMALIANLQNQRREIDHQLAQIKQQMKDELKAAFVIPKKPRKPRTPK